MFLKDILFPKFCLGCGYIGLYICPRCQKKLVYREKDTCLYCQKMSLFGLTHPLCQKRGRIDGLMSLFYYNDFLKKIIKNIKYRLATEVWQELGVIVEPTRLNKLFFYKNKKNFYFQPIPLHPKRLRERGFNQAFLVRQFFGQFLAYPQANFLERKKETLAQAQLKSSRQRYFNVLGAYAVLNKDKLPGKNLILVDDVVTTGSTLKEAARILKDQGAEKVYALTLAKG